MILITYLITGALFGSIAMILIVKAVRHHDTDDLPVLDAGQNKQARMILV